VVYVFGEDGRCGWVDTTGKPCTMYKNLDTLILMLVSSLFTFERLDISLCTQPSSIINYGSSWHVLGVGAFPKRQQVVVDLMLNDSLKLYAPILLPSVSSDTASMHYIYHVRHDSLLYSSSMYMAMTPCCLGPTTLLSILCASHCSS